MSANNVLRKLTIYRGQAAQAAVADQLDPHVLEVISAFSWFE
jgi:hypothetical protein